MPMQPLRIRIIALVAGVAVLAFGGWANADPPSRVARLGVMTGAVSFSPAGENDWVLATINRPLTTGDRLWADAGARAEIQIGGAMIRLNAATGVAVLNIDDQIAQLQLSQGTLNVRVRRLEPNQVFEVDTPNLAFTVRQPGEYRIEVDADGNATTIVVRKGQGEVYGEGASYVVDSSQPYRFTGTGLREYQVVETPRQDEFDRWSGDRDRSYDTSVSARYVSQDVVGYQDLDANGTWRVDASYGNVWVPNRVAAGWAPYQDGHWAWVDPWGWTWVDDAPWGFAVTHYGRWTNLGGTWGWVPGPVRSRAYYAPALVVFVGGNNFQLAISGGNVGGIAWFPLGPREVYRPSYTVSRGYFDNINRSNTVINTTVINNYYNNTNVTNVVYANRQVPGAVVAVPTTTFVQSQPVGRAAVRVTPAMIASAPVAAVPSVAPTERSVRGVASAGEKAPPSRVFERPVVARTAPPAPHAGFAAQQQQLTATPGKPLNDAARPDLRPAATAPTPVVKVVAPAQVATPTARPPSVASGAAPIDARGKSDQHRDAAPPSTNMAVGAPPKGNVPTPPPFPAQPPEQRGKSQASAPPSNTPQGAPPASTFPPQRAAPAATPPATIAAPAQPAQPPSATPPQRTTPTAPSQVVPPPTPPPEQRAKSEQRGPSNVPPPLPPAPTAAEPKSAPQQFARPPMAMQPPPQPAPPPKAFPPPQSAPPSPPARTEPAVAAKPPEQRPAVAVPKSLPPTAPPQPAAIAQPKGQEGKAVAGKPEDKKKDSDEQKREEDARKPKG
jgi:hypothetical protein